MKRNTKFALATIWILFSRSYDAYCTNLLTPNLEKEGNPLVSVFGLTWTPLLILIGLLTVYSIWTFYLSVYKPKNLLPTEKGYTFSNIFAYLYLGKKAEWYAFLFQFPKDINRFNQYMGHILSRFLVFAGIVSTAMWLLINHSDYYQKVHSAALIYSILILGCTLILYHWSNLQYRLYLKQTT